ncbi:MAG: hypothetical protein LBP26_04490 [Clostridiales bacterium]|jgi:hypothetical protein|nr:hypothetical protein [Clostridiales bacterium]
MQDPDQHDDYMKIAGAKPSILLDGKTPRLIDEWQVAPILWDAVRFAVDQRSATAQFIVHTAPDNGAGFCAIEKGRGDGNLA